jgi:cell filamentation protein
MTKYHVGGSQTLFQPGSCDQVLLNKLDLTDPKDMEEAELMLLAKLYDWVLNEAFPDRTITSNDLKDWHRRWLGNIYDWAGQERSVNLSKGDFHFAAAQQIPHLLNDLDKKYLSRLTPCTRMSNAALTEAIAIVHVEFILIHPFREGNGRLSRLLADVMAVQAGSETLDYSSWDAHKSDYFAAIQMGLAGDYQPMMALVAEALL